MLTRVGLGQSKIIPYYGGKNKYLCVKNAVRRGIFGRYCHLSLDSSLAMTAITASIPAHKNKTFATLLAFLLGGVGVHRYYLRGLGDTWGWVHTASVAAVGLVMTVAPEADIYFKLLPLFISMLAGFLQALVLGLMPDEKWDAAFNPASGRTSEARWPLALLLVATTMVGATALIATISRLFDLLYTGGAYG